MEPRQDGGPALTPVQSTHTVIPLAAPEVV